MFRSYRPLRVLRYYCSVLMQQAWFFCFVVKLSRYRHFVISFYPIRRIILSVILHMNLAFVHTMDVHSLFLDSLYKTCTRFSIYILLAVLLSKYKRVVFHILLHRCNMHTNDKLISVRKYTSFRSNYLCMDLYVRRKSLYYSKFFRVRTWLDMVLVDQMDCLLNQST